jgi:hypothetical protein
MVSDRGDRTRARPALVQIDRREGQSTACSEGQAVRSAPLASIIIPTWNRSEMACRAIDSCLAQSVKDIEVVVVDDGSTDDTAIRVGAYGTRVKYLYQENRRQGAARNLGVANSSAPWVLFLDSDDRFLPDKVAGDLATAARYPDAKMIYGGSRDVYRGVGHLRTYCPAISGDIIEQLVLTNFIVGATVAVRREVLAELGGFRAEPQLAGSEDWELWLRVAARYPIYATGLVQFERTVDTSAMMSDPDRMAEAMQTAILFAFEDPVVARRVSHLRRHAEGNVANISAAGFATAGRRRESLHYLKQALTLWPRTAFTGLFWYNVGRAISGMRSFRNRLPADA